MVNAFAFWQGQALNNATKTYFDDVMQAFGHIQSIAGGVNKAPELWNGETGWPTDGKHIYFQTYHETKSNFFNISH